MYQNKYIAFLILFLIQVISNAQSSIIKGTVTSNNNALEFINIYVKTAKKGTSSDVNGNYKFENLNPGEHQIVFSSIGFIPVVKEITLKENEVYTLNISLQENTGTIDEVVVSATMKETSKLESPIPVEVYTSFFFKSNPTPSIFESLQNVNGVRPQLNCNVCNTGDIHINGLEGPYTMVLIDGMPIVSGLSTVYGLTGIPQSLIDRVEIVKGPASTLYGSEAVGGLINIITKDPTNAPVIAADIFGSNWGDINTDLGFKFKASKKAQSIIGINYFNYQNPIDNNDDNFTDVTLQNRVSVFNKWNIKQKDNRIFTFAGRYVYENRWGGEMNWNESFRGGDSIYGESIYTKRWELFGTYQLPFKDKVLFQFSANGHNQDSYYGDMSFNADQFIGFGQLTYSKKINSYHDILLGATYRYTFYDDNTIATEKEEDNSLIKNNPSIMSLPGIFIQDEITLNESNKILLGARYDYNSIHGSVFTPRVNYKFTSFSKKNIVRVGIGNGYRVANVFTEDHAALSGSRNVEFASELKPETSWNANINFVKKIYPKNGASIIFDATAFYTYFNNRIIPDYDTDPNKIIYDNLNGFAVSQGISLNIDAEFKNGIKTLIGVTIQDVSSTENGIKEQQLLTEKWSGVWSIGYYVKAIDISFDYTGNIYGPMELPLLGPLDDRPAESPIWSIQNIQATKRFKNGIEIYGGVKNLLNFTPPANSIARPFDPFDKEVTFDNNGEAIATPNNPNALTFDPSYVYAPNQGIRGFIGFRYTL